MILRSLPHESSKIFLTFDDGPDAYSTPRILDLLARKKVPATFFLIGNRIAPARGLVERMRREGHSLGNHSSDHSYGNYFRGKTNVIRWMRGSESRFANEGFPDLVGFRPPAGIVTRHLKSASNETGIPVILWNERFFDAIWSWTETRARKSAAKLRGGSIVLLHDRQSPARLEKFLATLEIYIDALRARGFEFSSLKSEQTLAKSLPVFSDSTAHSETVPR